MLSEKLLYSNNTLIARKLRKEQTKAEIILWERLRDRRFKGEKFKRQHSMGNFITDFYCYSHKLIVEVDGNVHKETEQKEKDSQREMQITGLGFRVIRFTNMEVFTEIDRVLGEIGKYLS